MSLTLISFLYGLLDDMAIWSKALIESEIKIIYNLQKQKYAAHYDSPIVDIGAPGVWP